MTRNTPTTSSVAVRDDDTSPAATIQRYTNDFAMVLPPTFNPETFVRLAQGALRQNPKLRAAAEANPASLLVALLEAARLGHEPATEDYYLRPLSGRSGPSVQGIEGYKGAVKRMFNSGTVESVVAEAVHQRDEFEWLPGVMTIPRHRADWFGDRGPCIGAYAYVTFKGGGVSKVVLVGEKRIRRAISAAEGATSEYSPWKRDYEKMVVKTALRDLEPYVPKSAERQRVDTDTRAAALQVVEQHPELEPYFEQQQRAEQVDTGDTDDRVRSRVSSSDIIDTTTGEVHTAGDPLPEGPDGWPVGPEIKP